MTQKFYTIIAFLTLCANAWSQNIAVNETGAAPHPSAIIDASSTTKGFLPPQMTTAQRNAIPTPLPEGLTIYNTTSECLETWDGSHWFGPCTILLSSYPADAVFCDDIKTKVVPVFNPTTGKTWMDRNLGASRAAISSNDENAYGDLYQWGRRSDGHQCRDPFVTTTDLSDTDHPAHGSFIVAPNTPFDWRSPPNTNLWQGINGVNNPCPIGYRLPTETEWEAERSSWINNNASGAFASPLKLPAAGAHNNDGSISAGGSNGFYWSSTVSTNFSRRLFFTGSSATMATNGRAFGNSLRCIKD